MSNPSQSSHFILPLSGQSPEALIKALTDSVEVLSIHTQEIAQFPEEISRVASNEGFHHPYRGFVSGEKSAALCQELERIRASFDTASTHHEQDRSAALVFVFTGLGSEWWGMARELFEHEPVFKQTLIECHSLVKELSGWSLLGELYHDQQTSRLAQATFSQPALLAIQASLMQLWGSWGIKPAAVVGHSAGELAAAYMAGVLDLNEAVTIACQRGRLMDRDSSRGGMLAVAMSVEEVDKLLPYFGGQIEVAAVNGPSSTTLSGDRDLISQLADQLKRKQIAVKLLNINYAYHSRRLDPIRLELLALLKHIQPKRANTVLYSSVTGDGSSGEDWGAHYWWMNSRQKVHFAHAINQMIKRGYRIFLEIGPHASLQGSIKDSLQQSSAEGLVLASMRKGEHDQAAMYKALGKLYCHGINPNWKGVYGDNEARELPIRSMHQRSTA